MFCLCMFSLSVCQQDFAKTTWMIVRKLDGAEEEQINVNRMDNSTVLHWPWQTSALSA